MRRVSIILLITGILLTACAGSPAATSTPGGGSSANPTTDNSTKVAASSLTDYAPSDPAIFGTTGRPQIVEFYKAKCDICQSILPTMHRLEDQYGTMVDFIYINVDDIKTRDLQQKLKYMGNAPSIVFFDTDGHEKGRFEGMPNKTELETEIEDLVAVG